TGVRGAGEPRAEELDTLHGAPAGDPAPAGLPARSFKTLAARSGFLEHGGKGTLLAFLLFAFVAAVTPGPSNVMLVAAGGQAGIVRGLPCLLGVTSGMAVMMFLVPLGLGSLVLGHPIALTILHWGGAAFLLWLSWKIATSSSRLELTAQRDPVGYLGAAAFQWINPKSWLVSASAAGAVFGGPGGTPAPPGAPPRAPLL